MIRGERVLGLIPARAGSKGIPGKNIIPVGGVPLIGWTISAAKGSRYLDRLVLSSDGEEIRAVARELGCDIPFDRPAELARDETPGMEPVLHALDVLEESYDLLVLLQPTSPLRISADIDGAIERCLATGAPACVSVTPSPHSPYLSFRVGDSGRLEHLFPDVEPGNRQSLPPTYSLNGAVYVARIDFLRRESTFLSEQTVAYTMPAERSVDIDTPMDLALAEVLLGNQRSGSGSDPAPR